MLELIYKAKWEQAYLFLVSGDPPLLVKLLALNVFFFLLYTIRSMRVQRRLTMQGMVNLHSLIWVANCLVLFQYDIQRVVSPLIQRI